MSRLQSLGRRVRRRLPGPWQRFYVRLLRRQRERAADVLIVSFHRSGRTWLRLLLGRALARHAGLESASPLDLDRLARHPGIPRIVLSHDDLPQWKTPAELETDKRRFADKRVVLLIRDPRDVIVSSYFHKTRRLGSYRGTLAGYLEEERGGFESLLAFYRIWWENRAVPASFLLLRYEDLHADAAGELRRVLDFAGVAGVSDGVVEEAVRFASFDNLRKLEHSDRLRSRALRPGDPDDPESFKVRQGKIGGHADYLSPVESERLIARMRAVLPAELGYPARAGRGTIAASSSRIRTRADSSSPRSTQAT